RPSPPPAGPRPPLEPLSKSELRVLRYLPTNLSGPEIAGELYVSHNTVRTHMRHLYAKLGTHRRADTVARAPALRLLAPSPHPGGGPARQNTATASPPSAQARNHIAHVRTAHPVRRQRCRRLPQPTLGVRKCPLMALNSPSRWITSVSTWTTFRLSSSSIAVRSISRSSFRAMFPNTTSARQCSSARLAGTSSCSSATEPPQGLSPMTTMACTTS